MSECCGTHQSFADHYTAAIKDGKTVIFNEDLAIFIVVEPGASEPEGKKLTAAMIPAHVKKYEAKHLKR